MSSAYERARMPVKGGYLTRRESEVMKAYCDGEPQWHLAERLGISVRTVNSLITAAKTRLNVSSVKELMALYAEAAVKGHAPQTRFLGQKVDFLV